MNFHIHDFQYVTIVHHPHINHEVNKIFGFFYRNRSDHRLKNEENHHQLPMYSIYQLQKTFYTNILLQCFVVISLVLIDNQVHRKFLDDIYHTKDSSKMIQIINVDPRAAYIERQYISHVSLP